MVFYKNKGCRTTHKSRAAAFELESETELSTENARLAYQLSAVKAATSKIRLQRWS
jgi:hypothetical protein